MAIILASNSPRRRELLLRAGVKNLKVISPNADETVIPGTPPDKEVCRLAELKAVSCAKEAKPGDVVIAADTVVYLDGKIMGKPNDEKEAYLMLKSLSGRRHEVYTGVCVIKDGQRICRHEATAVWFKSLSDREIKAYIKTGEPMDKAGAYGIQDYGALLIERIEGDFFNVMGLPMCRLNTMLCSLGEGLL